MKCTPITRSRVVDSRVAVFFDKTKERVTPGIIEVMEDLIAWFSQLFVTGSANRFRDGFACSSSMLSMSILSNGMESVGLSPHSPPVLERSRKRQKFRPHPSFSFRT
jgi:hypothetical protein